MITTVFYVVSPTTGATGQNHRAGDRTETRSGEAKVTGTAQFDTLILNGTLIDPAAGRDGRFDVGV